MKKLMKMKKYAQGGKTNSPEDEDYQLADEQGKTLADRGGILPSTLYGMYRAERLGRQSGDELYSKKRRVQDSISNPIVSRLNKGIDYAVEKYGDLRDDVRTMVTNDDSAEFRKGQRRRREHHLGYKKGGSVSSSASKRADGIAKKGKTRGRFV